MYPTHSFVHLPSSELYFDMMSAILEANQDIEVTLKRGVMSQDEGGGIPHYHGVALPALDIYRQIYITDMKSPYYS